MQTKHTFLFTLILGLAYAGLLFGYQNGPDPASNGIFGAASCNASGCHVGNPLNAAGGSLTVSGLPDQWVAGQVYPLTVTMTRTGAVKYGFQLSAVFDSSNQQAGTLTSTSSRVSVVTGGGIQYAQHNAVATSVAPFTGTFTMNWTAPSSGGTVRFNVAGNAANGNVQNTGDFIYQQAITRPAAPTSVDNSVRAYTIVDRGGSSVITDGSGALTVGYTRIQPNSGNTTPTGVGIFGFRVNNVLVTEAGVPATPTLTAGRIYTEIGGPVNTGVAIANPNSTPAVVNFHFTNTAGGDFAGGSTTIAANGQIAAFLDQAPFNGGSFQGAFTFTSNVPISVIALRGYTNERGEFLITTLPVVNTALPLTAETSYLAHFADGGGWTTQVILVNPTDSTLTGNVEFMGQGSVTTGAVPVQLVANGQVGSSFPYSIPRRSSLKLTTSGAPPVTAAGSVRVIVSGNTSAPTALAIFSFKPAGVTVSEAGVPGIKANAFRMYVEVTSSGTAAGTIQTGLAIANVAQTQGAATLELFRLDGSFTGLSMNVTLPANGQVARFIHELFPTLTLPFQGVLRISGGAAAGMSVVGLRGRYNERTDFLITTTPPSNEGGATTTAELLFPHIVNGGGYTTQFVLFSGVAGQAAAGNLRFFTQAGGALNLILN